MAAKYRLLYLDTAPTAGGSVISLYELLKKLDRSRYEPTVVTYAPHAYVERFRALGLDVVAWNAYAARDHRPTWVRAARESAAVGSLQQRASGSSLYHALGFAVMLMRRVWPRARALRRIIGQKKIDLLHTNIRVGHDREGIVAAKMAGIPCVCHIRDFEQLDWFDKRLAGLVDSFIYISEAIQTCHLEAGVPCAKGRVVYNAVDVSAFTGKLDALRGRQSFHLVGDELAVGIVGRLERWKGQEVFLQAMALVRDAVPNVKGIVIGDPVPYDPNYRNLLLALCDELGLSKHVIFSEFRQDLPAVMSALDVLVLASTSPEPFGRVLIEAMTAGKPVVATDAGAVREIVEDGVHGLLVPPGEVQALARAIVHVLTHRDMAVAMGQEGQARVRERFDVQRYVDGVQAVYRDLLP
jgi:glycosyltransferase involved in cell wall biosynthesis